MLLMLKGLPEGKEAWSDRLPRKLLKRWKAVPSRPLVQDEARVGRAATLRKAPNVGDL
jgi:hypothetical protein